MRRFAVTALLIGLFCCPELASAKSVRTRARAAQTVQIDGNAVTAIESFRQAFRHAFGRLHLALRRNDVSRVVELVSTVEKFAALAMPGFRLPIDVHHLPILISRPAGGALSSPFGYRKDPIRKRRRKFHRGIDFHGKRGHPVHSAGPGVVTRAGRNGGYGRVVYIDHGLGLETRYAHLHRIDVKEGDFVPAGTLVGRIGSTGRSTGPHLHFEVRRNGRAINPDMAMDITLFDSGGFFDALSQLLTPSEWVEPPRAKRNKRRAKKRRAKKRRVPRSKRVNELW